MKFSPKYGKGSKMNLSYPRKIIMASYILLLIMNILSFVYGRNVYLFAISCFILYLSLWITPIRKHWINYLLFPAIQYYIIMPLCIIGLGCILFSNKLRYWIKICLAFFWLVFPTLTLYISPSTKPISVTQNLKQNDTFKLYLINPKGYNSATLTLENNNSSDGMGEYFLTLKCNDITTVIPPSRRSKDRVYFRFEEFLDKTGDYQFSISSLNEIPENTSVRLLFSMSYGKAVIYGLSKVPRVRSNEEFSNAVL